MSKYIPVISSNVFDKSFYYRDGGKFVHFYINADNSIELVSKILVLDSALQSAAYYVIEECEDKGDEYYIVAKKED